jgi:tetratricopeptide (TPR) repeat protein
MGWMRSLRLKEVSVNWAHLEAEIPSLNAQLAHRKHGVMANYKIPLFALLFFCILNADLWSAERSRIALVIGNQRYESAVGALRNSGNDAKSIARLLRGLGFSVTERYDLKRETLLRSMDDFRKSLSGAEVALFYYAGHGISIDGANYLIPIKSGFAPAGADSVSLHMLAETHLFNAEQAVVDMTAGGAKCNLVILDACRTTALAVSKDRGTGNGGTLVEMTPPTGSLIAFATDSGHTALDGDGKNGLYTEELLKNLATPGITIEQVFKRTRSGVIRRSQGAQVPAEYSRLVGDDIYLAGEQSSPLPLAVQVTAKAPAPETREEALAAICKLAKTGPSDAAECMTQLEAFARREGPGEYAVEPIDTLLERVKEELKTTEGPSTKAITSAAACDAILRALPDCVPVQDPRFSELTAKAHNRRGDALLLLGRSEEALSAYNAALGAQPNDAYVLYNRGNAHLALGHAKEARADFEAALKNAGDKPKAKKLAREALLRMK